MSSIRSSCRSLPFTADSLWRILFRTVPLSWRWYMGGIAAAPAGASANVKFKAPRRIGKLSAAE
ncbi:hypothetical protein PENSUB_3974 [Penicillium subrubescens]|uniref:Uncharacterized protein n=1 Tax=Penicillium subrubescens TaxID=1316194 RepID=A0A1Q5UDX1_9EURO|nr:hypothetical protein PENSUB_3974 [Penicillium subrubescens]